MCNADIIIFVSFFDSFPLSLTLALTLFLSPHARWVLLFLEYPRLLFSHCYIYCWQYHSALIFWFDKIPVHLYRCWYLLLIFTLLLWLLVLLLHELLFSLHHIHSTILTFCATILCKYLCIIPTFHLSIFPLILYFYHSNITLMHQMRCIY